MIAPDDPADDHGRDPGEPRPTRAQLTRAARAVNELGLQLTGLSPGELDRLELPERLRQEIDECRRLKPRSRGRQNRLIGQLLRAADHEAIREQVESRKGAQREWLQVEKVTESWLGRLVEEGDPAVEALIAQYPDADRRRLRALVRGARQDPEAKNTKRARRELLRTIRALRV